MTGIVKTLAIIALLGFGSLAYYHKDVSPAQPTGKDRKAYETRLEKKREPAWFMKLDDSILAEIKDSPPHEEIGSVPKEEVGKDELFSAPRKTDYHF